jgi:hypothetical protein
MVLLLVEFLFCFIIEPSSVEFNLHPRAGD